MSFTELFFLLFSAGGRCNHPNLSNCSLQRYRDLYLKSFSETLCSRNENGNAF